MSCDLTEENLQQVRTVAEFLPLTESCIAQVGSTDEGKRSVRLRQGLTKPLVEEALPIGIFGTHHDPGEYDVRNRHAKDVTALELCKKRHAQRPHEKDEPFSLLKSEEWMKKLDSSDDEFMDEQAPADSRC